MFTRFSRHSVALRMLAVLSLFGLVTVPTQAEEVVVSIYSLAPADGVFLTPVWVGFHDGQFDTYDRGAAISAGLERLVEDGATQPFSDEFAAASADGVQATLAGPDGPLFSGVAVSQTFDLDPSANAYFSYASMVIPSNDAFISNGNPLAHRVFDPNGNFTPVEFYVLGTETLDGGTEVNDELESSTAALGQTAADTGTDENGVVTLHPGFIPGGRILTARPNGDFLTPGQILAKVTITRAPNTSISFTGDGAQEVPPVDTAATAACSAVLNAAGNELAVECAHNVAGVVAAHVHQGAVGSNGPVVFPFDDPTSPLAQSFAVTADDVANLLSGGLYVNIHSETNPAGEVRAQIAGCFEGPEGLCLQGERFAVSATFESDNGSGTAQAVEATADSGQFTFFDPANVELDVKVLNGCAINGNYWVFIAGLTDVGVEITVTDTVDGTTRNYSNANGSAFELIRDTEAFACGS